MRFVTLLATLLLFAVPTFAAEIPTVSEPAIEEAAEMPGEETTETLDFGTMAPVLQSTNRGGCTTTCQDQCKAEATACRAACAPLDLPCIQNCFCERYFCLKLECSCTQDPPPGYCI